MSTADTTLSNLKHTCFIIVPGFDKDTSSVENIKKELEETGYAAFSVNFWGDGEVNFRTLTMHQAVAGLKSKIEEKAKHYDHVIAIGISLGGALLLEYAKQDSEIDTIVGVGIPFRLQYHYSLAFSSYVFFPILMLWWNLTGSHIKWLASHRVQKYLSGTFQTNLTAIKTPILLLQSTRDKVVNPVATKRYFETLVTPIKKLIMVDDVDHVLAQNEPIIFSECIKFVRNNNIGIQL